jgi:hypothetical protein
VAGFGGAGEEARDHFEFRGRVVGADELERVVHARVEAEEFGAPVPQHAQHHAPPVRGVTLAHDPAAAFEPVKDARHRRGVQPGPAGERGRAERAVAVYQVKAVQVAGAQLEMPAHLVVEQRQLCDHGPHRLPYGDHAAARTGAAAVCRADRPVP